MFHLIDRHGGNPRLARLYSLIWKWYADRLLYGVAFNKEGERYLCTTYSELAHDSGVHRDTIRRHFDNPKTKELLDFYHDKETNRLYLRPLSNGKPVPELWDTPPGVWVPDVVYVACSCEAGPALILSQAFYWMGINKNTGKLFAPDDEKHNVGGHRCFWKSRKNWADELRVNESTVMNWINRLSFDWKFLLVFCKSGQRTHYWRPDAGVLMQKLLDTRKQYHKYIKARAGIFARPLFSLEIKYECFLGKWARLWDKRNPHLFYAPTVCELEILLTDNNPATPKSRYREDSFMYYPGMWGD